MNFRRSLSGIFYSIGDAFDSAKVSPRRGTPPGAYPTDAKNELPSYTRNELVRRARYLEKNSGHIRGTLRDMKVYGIGDGIPHADVLLRTAGISLSAAAASALCEENGQRAAAHALELLGVIEVILAAQPILTDIFGLAEKMLLK